MKATVLSLAVLLLLDSSSTTQAMRLKRTFLADKDVIENLYSSTEQEDIKKEIEQAKQQMAQAEQKKKEEEEQRKKAEAKKKQEEMDKKIQALKQMEPDQAAESLTLKMGDKKIKIAGLNEKDDEDYVQLEAEPKTKTASDQQEAEEAFTSEERASSQKEVQAAVQESAKFEANKQKMAEQ